MKTKHLFLYKHDLQSGVMFLNRSLNSVSKGSYNCYTTGFTQGEKMHRAATASANFHSKIHPRMIFYDFRRLLPTLRFWYWQEWWESYACWETHMY